MSGRELFASYAFPPNELGYCGPPDTAPSELAAHAKEFDGAWPYLQALAEAAGVDDPLDVEVVRNYWSGRTARHGGSRCAGDAAARRLHRAGDRVAVCRGGRDVLAHHSFHVFVVYPWARFLDRDPTTPVRVMHDCRIRWGTVEAVVDDYAVIRSAPLIFDRRALGLGAEAPERVRWRKNGTSLAPPPWSAAL